jgi:hypothetical protein
VWAPFFSTEIKEPMAEVFSEFVHEYDDGQVSLSSYFLSIFEGVFFLYSTMQFTFQWT